MRNLQITVLFLFLIALVVGAGYYGYQYPNRSAITFMQKSTDGADFLLGCIVGAITTVMVMFLVFLWNQNRKYSSYANNDAQATFFGANHHRVLSSKELRNLEIKGPLQ